MAYLHGMRYALLHVAYQFLRSAFYTVLFSTQALECWLGQTLLYVTIDSHRCCVQFQHITTFSFFFFLREKTSYGIRHGTVQFRTRQCDVLVQTSVPSRFLRVFCAFCYFLLSTHQKRLRPALPYGTVTHTLTLRYGLHQRNGRYGT